MQNEKNRPSSIGWCPIPFYNSLTDWSVWENECWKFDIPSCPSFIREDSWSWHSWISKNIYISEIIKNMFLNSNSSRTANLPSLGQIIDCSYDNSGRIFLKQRTEESILLKLEFWDWAALRKLTLDLCFYLLIFFFCFHLPPKGQDKINKCTLGPAIFYDGRKFSNRKTNVPTHQYSRKLLSDIWIVNYGKKKTTFK